MLTILCAFGIGLLLGYLFGVFAGMKFAREQIKQEFQNLFMPKN